VLAQGIARQRAAEELARSSDHLAIIMRTIDEGVTAQDARGRVVYANDAGARMCGYVDAAEMLADPGVVRLRRFVIENEDGSPLTLDDMPGRTALRTGRRSERVLRVREPGAARPRWTQVWGVPAHDVATGEALAISVFRDITDRKHTGDAWRLLAETGTILNLSLDVRTMLSSVARVLVPALGDWCIIDLFEQGEFAPDQLAIAHADPEKIERMKAVRRHWRPDPSQPGGPGRALREGRAVLKEVVTFDDAARVIGEGLAREAMSLNIRSSMIVPLMVHGQVFGTISLLSAESGRTYTPADLLLAEQIGRSVQLAVENARLYEDAQQSIRVRDVFLSIASHELKTPITALLLQSQALERETLKFGPRLEPEKVLERTMLIQQNLERLSLLVDQLLDVSRISGGRLELCFEELDLVTVVRDLVRRTEDSAKRAGCTVSLLGHETVPGVWDRLRVEQIVGNLLDNALKYGQGQPVEIRVTEEGMRARISVTDHGIGIPLLDQARIFDRFERLVSERHYGGFGLGLWIVRQIVDILHGTVRVSSKPGEGATFVVTLPRTHSVGDVTLSPF
jgi:PAS domain S-box-containing protein